MAVLGLATALGGRRTRRKSKARRTRRRKMRGGLRTDTHGDPGTGYKGPLAA